MMSTNKSTLEFITKLHYYITIHELNYQIVLMDISNSEKEGRMITYEPTARSTDTTLKTTNVNILSDPTETVELTTKRLVCVITLLLSILLLRKL